MYTSTWLQSKTHFLCVCTLHWNKKEQPEVKVYTCLCWATRWRQSITMQATTPPLTRWCSYSWSYLFSYTRLLCLLRNSLNIMCYALDQFCTCLHCFPLHSRQESLIVFILLHFCFYSVAVFRCFNRPCEVFFDQTHELISRHMIIIEVYFLLAWISSDLPAVPGLNTSLWHLS